MLLKAVHVALVCVSHTLITVPVWVTRLCVVWFAGSSMIYCIPRNRIEQFSRKVFKMLNMWIIKPGWGETNTSPWREREARVCTTQKYGADLLRFGGWDRADIRVTYNAERCNISSYLCGSNCGVFLLCLIFVQMIDWEFLNLRYHGEKKSSERKNQTKIAATRSNCFSLISISKSTHVAKEWDVDTLTNKLWRKKRRALKGWQIK